jgi:hypothetical protein
MDVQITRFIFAALCGVFFLAIGAAAAWEWNRFARGESALSRRHLRWRMLSAAVWLVVLGSFFYATVALWPQNPSQTALAKRFLFVSIGASVLMVLAFVLMAVDVFWTVQVGRASAIKRAQVSQDALQRELERARKGSPSNRNGGSNGSKS